MNSHNGLSVVAIFYKGGSDYPVGMSSFLRRYRYIVPPAIAPNIGASQNNHNCDSAAPPTNRACDVLRAGLTEVFVIGKDFVV